MLKSALNPVTGRARRSRLLAAVLTAPLLAGAVTAADAAYVLRFPVGVSAQAAEQPTAPLATAAVSQFAGGGRHSLALKSDGTVWAVGRNSEGQLGDGTGTAASTFVQLTAADGTPMAGVVAIAAGQWHSLALRNDGTVWGTGYNPFGQLGDGTTVDKNRFVQMTVSDGSPVVGVAAIAASNDNSYVLKGDGTLMAVGHGNFGQLGDGTTVGKNRLVSMKAGGAPISDVKAIAPGLDFCVALKNDGTLWSVGRNDQGQLASGSAGVGVSRSLFGPMTTTGGAAMTGVVSISAGGHHSVASKADGSAWAAGFGMNGQLGDGSSSTTPRTRYVQMTEIGGAPVTGVSAVAAGYAHSLALKTDGSLWATGYNGYGTLADGTTTSTNRLGQMVAFDGTPMTGVARVAAGSGAYHSFALKTDGSPWAAGWNDAGQLGDGTVGDKIRFVEIAP